MVDWPVEEIPDEDFLYYRVHRNYVVTTGGKLHPGVFIEREGSMSVDWAKYSTAEQARLRAKTPDRNGVLALIAGDVREIEELQVRHEPRPANRAHSGVVGIPPGDPDRTRVRAQLHQRVDGWEIEPPLAGQE